MAEEGFKRKLTAILSADVEGYSRLMDDDEEATIRTLTSFRTAMSNLIQQYRGRVVAPLDVHRAVERLGERARGDPERLFYRSDHYNYAKHGIPIVFYFDGIHKDYHKVTDEVSKIDFEKYLKVTKTVFATGWTIANLPHRPVVNKVVQKVFGN